MIHPGLGLGNLSGSFSWHILFFRTSGGRFPSLNVYKYSQYCDIIVVVLSDRDIRSVNNENDSFQPGPSQAACPMFRLQNYPLGHSRY